MALRESMSNATRLGRNQAAGPGFRLAYLLVTYRTKFSTKPVTRPACCTHLFGGGGKRIPGLLCVKSPRTKAQ